MDSPLPPFWGSPLDSDYRTVFEDIPDGPLSDIMGSVLSSLAKKKGAGECTD